MSDYEDDDDIYTPAVQFDYIGALYVMLKDPGNTDVLVTHTTMCGYIAMISDDAILLGQLLDLAPTMQRCKLLLHAMKYELHKRRKNHEAIVTKLLTHGDGLILDDEVLPIQGLHVLVYVMAHYQWSLVVIAREKLGPVIETEFNVTACLLHEAVRLGRFEAVAAVLPLYMSTAAPDYFVLEDYDHNLSLTIRDSWPPKKSDVILRHILESDLPITKEWCALYLDGCETTSDLRQLVEHKFPCLALHEAIKARDVVNVRRLASALPLVSNDVLEDAIRTKNLEMLKTILDLNTHEDDLFLPCREAIFLSQSDMLELLLRRSRVPLHKEMFFDYAGRDEACDKILAAYTPG